MEEREERQHPEPVEPAENVEDLDVAEAEGKDVKGGALNAYLKLKGQKTGSIKGS